MKNSVLSSILFEIFMAFGRIKVLLTLFVDWSYFFFFFFIINPHVESLRQPNELFIHIPQWESVGQEHNEGGSTGNRRSFRLIDVIKM